MIDIDQVRKDWGLIKGASPAPDDHSKDAELARALDELEHLRSQVRTLEGCARDARNTAAWTGDD